MCSTPFGRVSNLETIMLFYSEDVALKLRREMVKITD
jgi:hypothetical protein